MSISNLQKMQRKLREQGRKVKTAAAELALLTKTKKEVDEVEALWKGMSEYVAQRKELFNMHLQSLKSMAAILEEPSVVDITTLHNLSFCKMSF
jgi:CheY-like chemotaxis protein